MKSSALLATLSLGVGLLFGGYAVAGKNPPAPNAQAFLAQAAEQATRLGRTPAPGLAAGQTAYLSLGALNRGQEEISVDNILAKLQERMAAGEVSWDEASDRWTLGPDHGRSPVPIDDPISVVLGPQGPVVVDGHHDVYLALYLGAETIPVHVVEDLSKLSPIEFWSTVKERQLVLLSADAASLAASPPDLHGVRDNPNRYLASLLALKATIRRGDDGQIEILKVKGASDGAWIKVNSSVPFVEFYLARTLTESGIHYDPRWGKRVPLAVIEAARQAFVRAKTKGHIPALAEIPILESSELATRVVQDNAALSRFLRASMSFAELCRPVFSE